MTGAETYLQGLRERAAMAGEAETAYRREAAARITVLERERAHAFRRAGVLGDVLGAMRPHEEEGAAVAAGLAHVRQRFGWPSRPEPAQQAVLDAFQPVAMALLAATHPDPEASADPATALEEFERWFQARSGGGSFWALLDQPPAADTPVVDF